MSGDKGAERVRANGHVSAESRHSAARSSIEPTEGVLSCRYRRAKPTPVVRALDSVDKPLRSRRKSDRSVRRTRDVGGLAVALPGDTRTSEVSPYGAAPSAEGRRGSASERGYQLRYQQGKREQVLQCCAERTRPKLSRRKTVTSGDRIDSANCTTRHPESGSMRRCVTSSRAAWTGLASVE